MPASDAPRVTLVDLVARLDRLESVVAAAARDRAALHREIFETVRAGVLDAMDEVLPPEPPPPPRPRRRHLRLVWPSKTE